MYDRSYVRRWCAGADGARGVGLGASRGAGCRLAGGARVHQGTHHAAGDPHAHHARGAVRGGGAPSVVSTCALRSILLDPP
eukprot:3994464-Pyramimonas_sp.AAC.1